MQSTDGSTLLVTGYSPKKCTNEVSLHVDDDTCSTSTDCTDCRHEDDRASSSNGEGPASWVSAETDSVEQDASHTHSGTLALGMTWLLGMLSCRLLTASVQAASSPSGKPRRSSFDVSVASGVTPTLQELHAANMRNRRLSSVAAFSPDELKSWQRCGEGTFGDVRLPTMISEPLAPKGALDMANDEGTAPSIRELHAANTRNRRLGLVAAFSPEDLRAWQALRREQMHAEGAGDEASRACSGQATHIKDSSSAAKAEGTTSHDFDVVSMRQLHEASTRKRRIGIVAALSPEDLRAWQEDRRREINKL